MDYNNENNYYVDNTHLDFSKIPTANPQEQASDSKMGLAITSMVIGILSLTLCCVCGSLLGILGLVFGIIALVKKQKGTGMAIAGVITSILGFLVGILILLYIVVVASTTKAILNSPDFQYYMEEYEKFDFEEFEDYDFSRFENF